LAVDEQSVEWPSASAGRGHADREKKRMPELQDSSSCFPSRVEWPAKKLYDFSLANTLRRPGFTSPALRCDRHSANACRRSLRHETGTSRPWRTRRDISAGRPALGVPTDCCTVVKRPSSTRDPGASRVCSRRGLSREHFELVLHENMYEASIPALHEPRVLELRLRYRS